ncbi:hypothetical protein BV898_08888 [Hypsibius exemplaris]|uniref:Chitin-binding type-2 domain-containing protein n=1 Tax=Hypsibius exemplaris TaxID=2072580 RepID=A0A1W0WP93_HYPEX|nr:hypothetical protein BV898_08888 [Hypsibius exemplaris]
MIKSLFLLGLLARMSAGQGGSINGAKVLEGDQVDTGVIYPPIKQGGTPPPQVPGVFEALDDLRGGPMPDPEKLFALIANATADLDYPILNEVPKQKNFNCAQVKQAGYYADTDFRCQAFRRCDVNGIETGYLCPNLTVFNQITLICDWFLNVDCAKSAQYSDYANSRLYHLGWPLHDTPPWKQAAEAARKAGEEARKAGEQARLAGAADAAMWKAKLKKSA